jgi:hypothetical protein
MPFNNDAGVAVGEGKEWRAIKSVSVGGTPWLFFFRTFVMTMYRLAAAPAATAAQHQQKRMGFGSDRPY